jgi:hypothetical protein
MAEKIQIMYGETALDALLQWLRSQDRPVDLETLTRRYLEILQALVAEERA